MSVLTSQTVTVTIPASSGSATANLTGITDITQCVPMMTKRITTVATNLDEFAEYCVRVDFLTGPDRVQCTTQHGDLIRALVVEVGVWEFDGTDDVVQSGQMTETTGGSWSDTIPVSLGSLTDTFLVSTWSANNNSNWHDKFNVRGVITDVNTVDFDISSASGDFNPTINWWTVEATTGNFATQPKTITIADTDSLNTATITSIAENKTFVVGSWNSADQLDRDAAYEHTIDCRLTNATTITVERKGSSAAVVWSGHAVTMAGANDKVQRGTITDDSSGNPTVDLTTGGYTSAGSSAVVHVAGCMSSHSSGSFNGTESSDGPDCHCAFSFEDGGDTLRMQRNTNGADNTNDISWEVIEWDVGAATAPRRVMVRG